MKNAARRGRRYLLRISSNDLWSRITLVRLEDWVFLGLFAGLVSSIACMELGPMTIT